MVTDFRLQQARAQPRIRDEAFKQWVLGGVIWSSFYRTAAGYLVRFPDLADFEISGDVRAVTCRPAPRVNGETCTHLYLNQVLPLILSKMGKLVFHASAVEIGACASVFVGESGKGKSTLAASFAAAGHRFLTDDGLVVEELPSGYRALPSHPSIRLWSDSENAIFAGGWRAAPAVQCTVKRQLQPCEEGRYCPQPLSIRGVYFLGDATRKSVRIIRVATSEAMLPWVRNSFLLDPQDRPLLASHFERVTRLSNELACFRLDYPRRYDELERVRRAIVEHQGQQDP